MSPASSMRWSWVVRAAALAAVAGGSSLSPAADVPQTRIDPPSPVAGGAFGASIARDGRTVLYGAPGTGEGGGGPGSATAVFYTPFREYVSALVPADGSAGDRFGISVALQAGTSVVGADGSDHAAADGGAAYVFGGGEESAVLTASDASPGDGFGRSVSLSGESVLVGAPGRDGGSEDRGAAYVFTRSGEDWSEEARILEPDAFEGARFGTSVSLDVDTAAVGAPSGAGSAGDAFVYLRAEGEWTRQAEVHAWDHTAGDGFGNAVSVSGDVLAVGAPGRDEGGADAGAVYVFRRDGSAWNLEATLVSPDPRAGDRFGHSVSIAGDWLLAGAPGDGPGGDGTGCAWAFLRTGGAWTDGLRLARADAAAGDGFGRSVSVGDSGHMAVGVPGTDGESAIDGGSASLFYAGELLAPVMDLGHGRGTIHAGGSLVAALDLVRGTRVSVDARFPADPDGAGSFGFWEGGGRTADPTEEYERTDTPGAIRVRRLLAWASGRFFVAVDPPTVPAHVLVRVQAPRRWTGEGVVGGEEPFAVTLGALDGARVTFRVRGAWGFSAVAPTILGVLDSDGDDLLLPWELRERPHSATARMRTRVRGGDVTVLLGARDGTYGDIRWEAEIDEPARYRFTIP